MEPQEHYTREHYTALVAQLESMAEDKYRAFQEMLIPGGDPILGVRIPALKKLARALCKGDFRGYLQCARTQTHEEAVLQGLVIGLSKMEIEEKAGYIDRFVPKISDWAVCDTFVASLKCAATDPDRVRSLLGKFLHSASPYEIRFGLVMLLWYYLGDSYIDDTLAEIAGVTHDAYYVQMAAAWAIAEGFARQREKTLPLLLDGVLPDFTHNKAIQKICESYRVSQEDKEKLRALRRKVAPAAKASKPAL